MKTIASRFLVFLVSLLLCACASTSKGEQDQEYSRALNTLNTETPMRDGRIKPLPPTSDIEKIKGAIKSALNAYQAQNFVDAEASYYQAEEFGANDETILYWLGNYSILTGDVESARHYYEDLLRINPVNAKALYNLATVYLSKAENYFQFYTASIPEDQVEQDLLRLLGSIDRFSDASQKETEKTTLSPLDSLRQLLEQ